MSATILVAVRAADGLAAISDRKETVPLGSPRNVKKFHVDKHKRFYISLAGDGPLADGVPVRLARARTGPADAAARVRGIAAALHSGRTGEALQAGGFLIIAGRAGLKLCSICISGRHVDTLEDRNGASARGDGLARVLCQYIARGAGFSGMPCEEAARHPHVPAGDVAERADGAGGGWAPAGSIPACSQKTAVQN